MARYVKIVSFAAVILLLLFSSCRKDRKESNVLPSYEQAKEILEKNPYDLNANFSIWGYYSEKGMYDSVIYYARKVRNADSKKEVVLRAYSDLMTAQSYLFMDRFDSVKFYMDEIESKWSYSLDGKLPLNFYVLWHNILGVYAIRVEFDYPKSLDHFNKALEYSLMSDDKYNACIFLCNIVNIYTIRRDTLGMSYARRAHSIAEELDNDYLICFSAIPYSTMFSLKEDYDNALKYVEEALVISKRNGYGFFMSPIYLIMANIKHREEEYASADSLYREAFKWAGYSDPSTYIKLCYTFGTLLYQQGNMKEAEMVFKKGLELSTLNNNIEYRNSILLGLSMLYDYEGKTSLALDYYKRYHAGQDSVFNQHNEREFNQLLLKYEKAVYDNKIKEKEKSMYVLVSVSVIALLVGIGFYILYTRKNRMYRSLVEQHQQYLQRKEVIEKNAQEDEAQEHNAESRKDRELYDRINEYLVGKKMYLDNDISLEKICELVGTNRVYVSKAINKYAQMSFYNYINSLRIEEATRVLSDPEDDTPLKVLCSNLGYNSTSAFYRAFQKETGCPPSKYREQIKQIAKAGIS